MTLKKATTRVAWLLFAAYMIGYLLSALRDLIDGFWGVVPIALAGGIIIGALSFITDRIIAKSNANAWREGFAERIKIEIGKAQKETDRD